MMRNRKLLNEQIAENVRGWAELAEYSEQVNPLYRNNALIEALPQPLPTKEFLKLIKYYPEHNGNEIHTLPPEDRLDLIDNISQVFQPLDIHVRIYRRLIRAMRGGYVGRDIFEIRSRKEIEELFDKIGVKGTALARGLYIIGMSRMGKTTTVERILRLIPQVIYHSLYAGKEILITQVPWLKLECPYDSSTKALCLEYFDTLDKLLGTNFSSTYGRDGKASTNKMQIDMAFLSDLVKLGILVIDEIERLNTAKSGGADKMLDFFVTLSNITRVPIVLIGTYEAFNIFTKAFKHSCRGTRQGDIVWKRMKQTDSSWEQLLKGIWRYQYVAHPTELTSELSEALYYVSQGVTEVAVNAFLLAQERAIEIGHDEIITPDLIYSVAADSMALIHKPIDILRRSETMEIQNYRDLDVPKELEDSYINNEQSPPNNTQEQSTKKNGTSTHTADKGDKKLSNPDVIVLEDDLRNSLQKDDGNKSTTYDNLKANGEIGEVDDFLPAEADE